MMLYDPVAIARQFLFVREASQNTGQRVNAIQKWCGGQPGESWCAYLATMVLDIAFQGVSPIPREGSCETIHQLAQRNGWIVETPSVGDIVLSVKDGHAHHIGLVTSLTPLTSIAGNTSEDGTSSNGDRVAEHGISAANKVFVHYPR